MKKEKSKAWLELRGNLPGLLLDGTRRAWSWLKEHLLVPLFWERFTLTPHPGGLEGLPLALLTVGLLAMVLLGLR